MAKRRGVSYQKRVADINGVYERYAKEGLPNREIWRRHIYPVYGICERTFYNIINASVEPDNDIPNNMLSLFNFEEENG